MDAKFSTKTQIAKILTPFYFIYLTTKGKVNTITYKKKNKRNKLYKYNSTKATHTHKKIKLNTITNDLAIANCIENYTTRLKGDR